jgi:hypothetical protein
VAGLRKGTLQWSGSLAAVAATIQPGTDKKFDDGVEDIVDDLDLSRMTRPGREPRRANVDLPTRMVEALDREARRIGVTRQSIIKVWLAERLERAGHGR